MESKITEPNMTFVNSNTVSKIGTERTEKSPPTKNLRPREELDLRLESLKNYKKLMTDLENEENERQREFRMKDFVPKKNISNKKVEIRPESK